MLPIRSLAAQHGAGHVLTSGFTQLTLSLQREAHALFYNSLTE